MLITRETDYALRLLRGLANGELATAGELAERELVPQQFAYKILKKLSKAGFLHITRGAEGGCRLTADLRKVTLYDLMEAMEADALVSACMEPGYQCTWQAKNGDCCTAHRRLGQVQAALNRELKAHSLSEILTGDG